MSNSGTETSCFADFMSIPNPDLRTTSSLLFPFTSSGIAGNVVSGEAGRVEGSDGTSMSMTMEDLRRCTEPVNNGGREDEGLLRSVPSESSLSFGRTKFVGRSKDQDFTRSKANAWHPA